MADNIIRNIPYVGYGSWQDPVPTVGDLPAFGEDIGDVKIVTSTQEAYVWNGTSWVLFASPSFASGIVNLNGLSISTQFFATGTAGTDFNIASSVATHTFNLPDAGPLARGVVTNVAQTFAGTKTFSSIPVISPFTIAGVVHNNASGLLSSSLIVNADVDPAAGIVYSKLTLTNSIVNADINTAAGIALSKLAALTASRALQSDGSGVISVSTTTAAELAFVSGVTSAIQTQLNNKQPLDATLTALAAYNTNGYLVQTAADTFVGRSIAAGTGITVTNGNAVAGNSQIAISDTAVTPGTYGSSTQVGVFTVNQQGQLTNAVNTAISLTSSSISDFNEAAQDAVGSILTDTASVDFTYNDAANIITADVLPGGVNHNLLLNYVANQHIDHSTVNINAGAGLTGGGDITTSRTISMPNVGTAGTFGSASSIPVITTDAQGRVSAVTPTAVSITSSSVTDFNEAAQDAVGTILTDTSTIDFTYNDAGNTITADIVALSITNALISNSAAIARTKLASGTANHVIINDGSGVLSSEAQLAVTRGGTGLASVTTGDILYASASNVLSRLPIGTTNQILQVIAGIPSWQTIVDAGITSLNGLTALSQTFATGTSGTDFNINSTTSTHTFNIPDASATARGLVTTGAQVFAGVKTFSVAPIVTTFSTAGIVHNNASGLLSSSLIVNADVDAAAAIVYSKLNLSNSIVNADVNTAAAIAYSKLNLSNSIVNADINTAAAIAYSKLNLSNSIVNADVNSAAAIAYSKLAALTASTFIYSNASGVVTATAAPTNGQLLIGSTGAIPVVASLTGTANQITVTPGAGSITLSIPQNINTGASPTFTGLTLSGLTSGSVIFAGTSGVISQNNAAFFWDNTNSRLGLGINTPQSKLHVDSGNATASAIKLTAGTTTGTTATDGFELGIDTAGAGELRQRENLALNIFTNNTRYLQLTSTGRFLIGNGVSAVDITGLPTIPVFQIIGDAGADTQMAAIHYSADTTPPVFNLLKSRGTINTQGLVSSGDELGRLQFRGSDGVNFQAGASVRAAVDGVAAAGSMPGRLIFMTTPTSSTAPAERMRITQAGNVLINATTPDTSALVQMDSTTQGMLMPRMTATQRLAIGTPATGLRVYDTTVGFSSEYNGTTWIFEHRKNTTATQSSTSATYADITELVTSSLDAGLYAIELRGIAQSTAVGTGVGFRLAAGTATVSTICINWCFSQAAAGTDKNFEYSQTAAADNVTSASVQTANSDFPILGSGVFRITAAGTVAVQIRTETGGTGVSIRTDSSLFIRKVG